ncbi:MAG: hypothetical protein ACT4OG_04150 [Alphaproteobacteria bacterium]
MKILPVLLGAAAITAITMAGTAWAQDSGGAMDQLEDATSGTQSTGETFDGGNTPTDAYPSGTSGESGSDSSDDSESDPD